MLASHLLAKVKSSDFPNLHSPILFDAMFSNHEYAVKIIIALN